ncbi:hypothetical protein U1Q18_016262 [Sarracenia purpurea var. burkii]
MASEKPRGSEEEDGDRRNPGRSPSPHLRRPVQPRREIRVSAGEISERNEGVILGNFFSEGVTSQKRATGDSVLGRNLGIN